MQSTSQSREKNKPLSWDVLLHPSARTRRDTSKALTFLPLTCEDRKDQNLQYISKGKKMTKTEAKSWIKLKAWLLKLEQKIYKRSNK